MFFFENLNPMSNPTITELYLGLLCDFASYVLVYTWLAINVFLQCSGGFLADIKLFFSSHISTTGTADNPSLSSS